MTQRGSDRSSPGPVGRRPSPLPQRVGRFRILGELGRGGMGVVYGAIDPNTGTQVALKVLLAADHAGDEATHRFLREAEAARQVDHPNVVDVHELGWHEGKPYFTMDLVDGGSLDELRGAVKDATWYAKVMAGVAEGLHAAHCRGLAHRDVKPANILLDGETPRLTDFGLARELSGVGARLTATGQVLGTPSYMAPEQAGNDAYDPAKGDQYSVGAVLYDLLAGRPPHDGDHPVAIMMSLASAPPPPLLSLAPEVPPPLARIVEQAIRRDPNRRYPDCAALADDLRRFVEGASVNATAAGLREWAERRLMPMASPIAILLGLGFALLVGFVVRTTWLSVRTERHLLELELAAGHDLVAVEADIEAVAPHDPAEAVRLLDDFIARHRGTQTATRAVLRHLPHTAQEEPDAAVALLAEVYGTSTDVADQDRVLDALAGLMEDRWDWVGLAAVTATQLRRHPLRAASPALAGPRGRVALAMGRSADAAAIFESLDQPGAAALARAMSTRLPTIEGLQHRSVADWDGDGHDEIVALVDGTMRVHELVPGLPVEQVLDLPDGPWQDTMLITGSDRRGVARSDDALWVFEVGSDGQLALRSEPVTGSLMDVTALDLDEDGHEEIYIGLGPYQRTLLVVDEEGFREAHPSTTAARSDVTQLLGVVGPSGPELWAAVGPWSAYDLRRFGPRDHDLTLLDRRRLGYVTALLELDDGRVAALNSPQYPSRRAFGGDGLGPPLGIYLLHPDDPSRVERVPWQGPLSDLNGLHEGDVDGDGLPDLLVSAARGSDQAIVVRLAESNGGYAPPLTLRGGQVVWVGQLDDDPAEELLLWSGPGRAGGYFFLGVGDVAEVAASEIVPPAATPPGLPRREAAAWERAEDLVAMGLYAPAATAFVRLAEDHLDPTHRPLAVERAARLHEADGDLDAAAERWGRLVGTHPQAASRAAENLRAAHRFAAAAAVEQSGGPEGDTTWPLIDRDDHPQALTVLDPIAATWHTDGLSVQAVSGEAPFAGVATSWDGRHLGMEVTVRVRHLEWASGLVAEFAGTDLSLALRSYGGGGLYHRTAECPGTPGSAISWSSPSVALDESWTLRLDWFDGELLCQITAPDGTRRTATRPMAAPEVGRLTAQLKPSHLVASHTLTRATITSWQLTASADVGTLSAHPPIAAPPSPGHGMRIRPAIAVPERLEAVGEQAVVEFRDVHAAMRHTHPDAPVTHRAYTVHAAPLLALDPATLSPPARSAYIEILVHRGMAWLEIEEPAAARAHLERAQQLLPQPAQLPLAADDPTWPLRVDLALSLAAAWVDEAPETARRHVRHALQLHPVPELAADQLRVHPRLQTLEDTMWP